MYNRYLVKLTSQIKKQFSRRKSTLATFFDVKKAYDTVWHSRLLYKLKSIGVTGKMYYYIKDLLSCRSMCVRLGTVYSSFKDIDMGIPQGSIIAPILFSILIYDLPQHLSKNTNVVQYADDIAMWMNTTLRKNTNKRTITHVQKLYQYDLDNLNNYMKDNGLELSSEKTYLMLFNNGENPKTLPTLSLDNKPLAFKPTVKFLGVYITRKLNWRHHIEYLITKANKRLNFLKIINRQSWSQDTQTMLHLAISLVRSKLLYGQEVYFTASNTLLKKLQSVDSKAIKLALGVPVHTNTMKSYKESNVLPLTDQRELAVTKYVIRALAVKNSVKDELLYTSETDYPQKARKMHSLQPIRNFAEVLLSKSNIDINDIPVMPLIPSIPSWELEKATFDIDYINLNKTEEINILVSEVKSHLTTYYPNHLKIFTDGSVLDTADSGAGFVIPALKVQQSFYIGKGFSIFTSELYAILMALNYINSLSYDIYNILLCVDSKSVLRSLKQTENVIRNDIICEIKHLIHCISSSGVGINFCWVPSHCGLYWNEVSDKLAKDGASNNANAETFHNIRLSVHELGSMLECSLYTNFSNTQSMIPDCPRQLASLIYKLRLNSWKTKYTQNVCICSKALSVHHLLFECPILLTTYRNNNLDFSCTNSRDILYNKNNDIISVVQLILRSPVGRLL